MRKLQSGGSGREKVERAPMWDYTAGGRAVCTVYFMDLTTRSPPIGAVDSWRENDGRFIDRERKRDRDRERNDKSLLFLEVFASQRSAQETELRI